MKYRLSIKRVVLAVAGLALLSFIILCYSVKFRISDDEVLERIQGARVTIDYLPFADRQIRNILVERENKTLLILLHGSPSSSAQWVPLVNDSLLSEKVDFLMIDRPGYGYSSFGNPILSVEKQTQGIQLAIRQYVDKYQKVVVFGTSYGGTIGARLLMDYPDLTDGALLMSSSMAPGEERIYKISYLIEKIPWLFPSLVVVANEEKMSHYDELKKMEPLWGHITSPVLFIHSTSDDLVYPGNIPFVLERLNANVKWDTLWVQDGEHSLYWSDRELVKSELNGFVDTFAGVEEKYKAFEGKIPDQRSTRN
ncbi:MAG: alpha/beta hydrolase [Bacteroidota bacterium]